MAEKKILCPLMGGVCIEDSAIRDGELVACRFWVEIQGKNPQDGAEMKGHDCSFALLPVLMLENARVGRQIGAAVESSRNEVAKRGDVANILLSGLLQTTGGTPTLVPSIEHLREVGQ